MPVFDQGYQHWSGKLSGHTWRWLTITRQGVRVGMKNFLLRIFILFTWVPAVALAFMLCFWGLVEQKSSLLESGFLANVLALFPPEMVADPKHFRVAYWTLCFHQFLLIELYLSMVVVLVVGPGLIGRDLRFNALQLYFSRPLRRLDYFVGKLGVIAWFLSLVVIFPSLIAYGLGLLVSRDLTLLTDTFPLLLGCLAYGAVIVVSAGTLMLALSSLSRLSRYVVLCWVALLAVGGILGTVLNLVDEGQRQTKHYRKQAEAVAVAPRPAGQPVNREEQLAQQRAWQEASRKAQKELEDEEREAAKTNWRPLVSYTANLWRVGHRLLDTDAAWTRISELAPPDERDRVLQRSLGPQYPWYWSAAVLAALFGLSVCILNYRVRSLDRLR
jgi:ABC-2 type transport system permease protein